MPATFLLSDKHLILCLLVLVVPKAFIKPISARLTSIATVRPPKLHPPYQY
jgi:hypothetical protein